MIRTFKTKLLLDHEQREYFNKAFGIRRWTWNWAWYNCVKTNNPMITKVHEYELVKVLNALITTDETLAWHKEVNSMVRQSALEDFALAHKAWLKKRSKSNKGKPRPKKKGIALDTFRLFAKGNPVKYLSPHHVSMTRVRGLKPLKLQVSEQVTFLKTASIKTCTVTKERGEYYICLTYEKTNRKPRQKGTCIIGLDLGVKHTAVGYDGKNNMFFDIPATLSRVQEKINRSQRNLSKKVKDSKRYNKAKLRLEKAYYKATCIRKDFRDKLTTYLVATYNIIKIDDFSFKGFVSMQKARGKYKKSTKAAVRKVYDIAPFALKATLQYKAEDRGNMIIYVKRGTPTTKTCSCCGQQHLLSLKDRTYECPSCGLKIDRDLNSAINVYNYV